MRHRYHSQWKLKSPMENFAVKVLSLVLLTVSASAKRIAPLEHSQSQASCPVDDAGVAAASVITEGDDRFASFKRISDGFENWMNLSISPCEDFYGYACKKGQTNHVPPQARISTLLSLVSQLEACNDAAYFEKAAKPLKQVKHLYDKCVNTDATTAAVADSMKRKFEALKNKIGVNFPMGYQSEEVSTLTPDDLANLLGFPSEIWAYSFVVVQVYHDIKAPNEINSRVYIDQPYQMASQEFYANWTYYKPIFESKIIDDMNEYAASIGATLNQAKLKTDAAAVADMDYALGNYVTDKYTRRNYEDQYNLQTLVELQNAAPAFNWINLLKAALTKAQAPELINATLQVVVREPEQIANLSRDIAAKKLDPATIANYVYYRALLEIRKSAPPVSDKQPDQKASVLRQVEKQGIFDRRGRPQPTIQEIVKLGEQLGLDISEAQVYCLKIANANMNRAYDRLFIDKIYPTPEAPAKLRRKLEEMTSWIISGFRTQIDKTSWMAAESKQGAYKKLDNIQLNLLYDDWITDDVRLTDYYSELLLDDSFNTIDTFDAVFDLRLARSVENFRLDKPRDRTAFFGDDTATTYDMSFNWWFNNLKIYAEIAQPPTYDANYPAAVNFGRFGTVIGHEVNHGFDDEGIQTDYIGALYEWIDDSSYAAFKEMASCVVREYGAFCPTNYFCIDGVNTQGENMADNGGLQAAYNAFIEYEAYYGPDPRLPDFGSKFSNLQLFFIGFAHGWCFPETTENNYKEYYTNDLHSPPDYRVFGAIQNFPAFRTAFNCPLGSAYAPKDHCDVWTSPPGA